MKYNRKLKASSYQGCNDRLAKAIDVMAGYAVAPTTEQPNYNNYRGAGREINSANDRHYDSLAKNMSDKQKERKRLEAIEWYNNACKEDKS